MATRFQLTPSARIPLLRQALLKTPDSPRLLFELSEALSEDPENPESIEMFRRAFELNPFECSAIGRGPDQAAQSNRIRSRAKALIRNGLMGSSVIAALAVGESLCGNENAVRWLIDYDGFYRIRRLATPEGFDDFFSTLADEIRSGMVFYEEPVERSIRRSWRNNKTTSSSLPASAALTASLKQAVAEYMRDLAGDPAHPFLASRPSAFRLGGWAVISDGSGYHKAHIHPEGWMGGVYYVVRPEVSRQEGTRRGWLKVGPPDTVHGAPVTLPGWETRFVEPEPGNLVLMPSYFYHETQPMGVEQERICVAFDIIPVKQH